MEYGVGVPSGGGDGAGDDEHDLLHFCNSSRTHQCSFVSVCLIRIDSPDSAVCFTTTTMATNL